MSSELRRILGSRGGHRVLIVGDVMLDELLSGDVLRLSPEAPIPVVEVTGRSYRPGGAANVAANARSLGAGTILIGVVGADREAGILKEVLDAEGIVTSGLLVKPQHPTTHKTRIIAGGQYVARIDNESRREMPDSIAAELRERAIAGLADADACVVSDYAKGVVSRELCAALAAEAARLGKPLVVDPKRKDLGAYAGATIVTPNLHELELAVGARLRSADEVVAGGRVILPRLGGGALLVTRGAAGMTLLAPDREPLHCPATARSVFDVVGAGDTVVGTLAVALARGLELECAVDLSSRAAGIAVSKRGTATVSLDELLAMP
jgi:D-beta-D-heptose 7-phosphate kinase/D-beta-D-heptose 1-phosphate adenosyltransferase